MASPSSLPLPKTIVLIGMMGAGKTCIGRQLAERFDIPFTDADSEIAEAAGCSVSEIFDVHGEAAFRDGERRVISRLLDMPIHVLATGGGAFMDEETRHLIKEKAISIWLRADIDLLLSRVLRRNTRPLLKKGDPRQILEKLIAERYPVYEKAEIIVDSVDAPPEVTVENAYNAVKSYLESRPDKTNLNDDAQGTAR
ncbi:MAG: shikimate kinase [Rhodospirillaceae bacterium]|nr:shikimate kinase [Rhodospirillaceae bacterium]MBT5373408.1 shikimate kinase [Rhodospirillaceae bacterium]MBT5659139.1 shikimate kinase [Rhodospirillaceae bacterium]MBT5751117.1 shikimate kinase [Rhodospirillaceae bacterium]